MSLAALDPVTWLDALAARLPRHAAVLRVPVDHAQRDGRIRTVIVGCSIGRGVADEWSDLDANMSVADDAWPGVLDDAGSIVRSAGDPVDVLMHLLPDVAAEHRRVFVQYRDGVQLDLVLQPVSAQTRRGRAPDVVALYDPDDRLGEVVEPRSLRADGGDVREWCVLGWADLADVVKYLRRDSLWEALERLHSARTQVWRLWAVATGTGSPVYGLTAVLDSPQPRLPAGIEATVAPLTPSGIAFAAHTCATLLTELWPRAAAVAAAAADTDAVTEPAVAHFVRAQIDDLPAVGNGDDEIRVVPHDPAWARRFDEQRVTLERLLAPWLSGGVHHVGSTSVPGLDAKPIVDITAGVRSLEEAREAIAVLTDDGWLHAPYKPEEMHWFCRPSPLHREYHLHLVATDSPAFRDRLAFRDALRADPALRERYTELKHELAERFRNDRTAYTEGKSAFIESVVRRPDRR